MRHFLILANALLVTAIAAPLVASPSTTPVKPKPGETWVCPKDGSTMIYVPPGEFTMSYGATGLEHKWKLSGYWVDKLEVTNKQFLKFVKSTGYTTEGHWTAKEATAKPQLPAMGVTWKDACAYAQWAGKRLPLEAEWERAARGTDGRIYPWGNEWDASKAVVGRKKYSDIEAVGTHPGDTSAVGCLDMAGNVQEWCYERYMPDAYERYSKGDFRLQTLGFVYSVRGRGAISDEKTAQSYYRYWATPGYWWCGFRCVIGPEPKYGQLDIDYPCDMNPTPKIYRTATRPESAKAGDVWISPKNGAEMVYIPAGTFKSGYDKKFTDASTGSYWISRYPVTVAQYRAFVQQTKYKPLRFWKSYSGPGSDSHPAYGLAYEDAAAYAKWLGFRLPTAKEWEKAARGTDGRDFPWGDKYVEDYVIPFYYSDEQPVVPVGTRPQNCSPYGVWDMCTMSSEWVDDVDIANASVGSTSVITAGGQSLKLVQGRPPHVEKVPEKTSPAAEDKRVRRRMMNGLFGPLQKSEFVTTARATMEVAVRQADGKTYPDPSNDWENHAFRCVVDQK